MNKLLLASLVGLASSTTAVVHADSSASAPHHAPPPMLGVCVPGDKPMFEIDTATIGLRPASATTFTLYANGTWTYEARANGKITASKASCIAPDRAKAIRTLLARATWKTSHDKYRCMAVAMDYTEYKVDGAPVLSRQLCDGIVLDGASAKVLADVNQIVASLMA